MYDNIANRQHNPESKKWYSDIHKRWIAIHELIEKYGTDEDKIAWLLCRDDAAGWRVNSDGFEMRDYDRHVS